MRDNYIDNLRDPHKLTSPIQLLEGVFAKFEKTTFFGCLVYIMRPICDLDDNKAGSCVTLV